MNRSLALITTTLAVSSAAPHTYDFSLSHAVAKTRAGLPYATLDGRVRLQRVPAGTCRGFSGRDLLVASFDGLEARCDSNVAPNSAECQQDRSQIIIPCIVYCTV